ncbi:hypothetical protein PUNSTDRAFT_53482 [Punctularia strigosozonata HHB-11173 SS5]|uniref:uncharacterized protein n=1 Tax=Punctularia strigosozonata (strain HHB-11173) TaxID=741275 RepID=UPI00044185E8|nr:uncharacterized protein PUNSTDRAFT_53482 [Punctularia strigosozonata HHB-11173 SS5]EIN07085.1 hypothetical protein PUNSTDRAFT_53482 [Punctularia strigosozonata HHB-11173 SS5]
MGSLDPDWKPIHARENVPAYRLFTKPIEKSEQDDRDYRVIELLNGLQATIVSDPAADKAAASLDVAVGHLFDPDDMPGLAHFCEHLLFMGTESYPKENEYSEFLAKNGGASNAFTSTMNTNYYFRVNTPALRGALARFAAFFHCPLFSPSCTLRELNAVDSEHKKNHQNDIWRIYQLNKNLSREGHPWSKFGTGNKATLEQAARQARKKGLLGPSKLGDDNLEPSRSPSPAPSQASTTVSETEPDGGVVGRETRRRLVEWWTKEYCASRMKVCIIGKESLDELSDLVSLMFSPIPNRGATPLPTINEHPFGPNEKATIVSVQTIMDFHAMETSWPLAWQAPLWRYKPANFISHYLGHEGPGSLHSYLKNKGWITALSSGPQNLGRGFAMMKVTIHLTNEGFRNHRSVMLAVFKYLSLLRSSAIPAWAQRETSLLSRIRFRFREKRRPDDYAVSVAEYMSWPTPRELILSGPALDWEWKDEEGERLVRELLNTLRVSEGRAVLMARGDQHALLRDGQDADWKQEPVYGTKFLVDKLDAAFMKEAESGNDIQELFLPGPNEFIPTNLEVEKTHVTEPSRRPFLIRDTHSSTLWHKKDDQFWVPKAHVVIQISSSAANTSPKASVMTRLYTDLVKDSVNEFAYNAELAGLGYDIGSWSNGISISLFGYNDKLAVLGEHILERARHLPVKSDRLNVMKEQLKRDWKNFFLGQPYSISDYYARDTLSDRPWTLLEKLEAIDSISAEDMQEHGSQLLKQTHIRGLVVGNMSKQQATSMMEDVERILGSSALAADAALLHCRILPEGSNYVYRMPTPNPNEPNSSLTYYVRFGPTTDRRLRVKAALLSHLLAEPAFNILRTKEQLGYIVSCAPWTLLGDAETGMRVVVQSERGPAYLERRVDAFLRGMKEIITEMTDAPDGEFEQQKAGLEKKWREKPKNLKEESNRYWSQVENNFLDFYRRDQDADLLRSITKAEILDLFSSRVHPDSKQHAKLSIHMKSQKQRAVKLSFEALQEFERSLKTAVPADSIPPSWKEDLGVSEATDEVSAVDLTKYWLEKAGSNSFPKEGGGTVTALLNTIPELARKHNTDQDSEEPETEAQIIEDIKKFRDGLRLSADAQPLVDWGDLNGDEAKL